MKKLVIELIIIFVTIGITLFIGFSGNAIETLEYISKHRIITYILLFVVIFAMYYGIGYVIKRKKEKYISKVDTNEPTQDFEELYNTLRFNCIEELEILRKKVRIRQVLQYILYIPLAVGYVFAKSDSTIVDPDIDSIIAIGGMILGFVGVGLTYLNVKYTNNYKKAYKQKVITNFIKLVDTNLLLVEQIEGQLAKEEYMSAAFDNKTYNRFSVSDQINGSIEESSVKVWDIDVKKVTGSGKNKDTENIFQGIFSMTECENDLEGYVKISKNKLLTGKDKINLDSKNFEKYFDVYSTNKILTLRILTHDIMEMLVDFYNKYNLDYEIVFNNNKIYLRFSTIDMFEPKVFGSSINKELLYKEYVILKFILGLTKKVNEVQLNIQ